MQELFDGNLTHAEAVYTMPHHKLCDACDGTTFLLRKPAIARVIKGYLDGSVSQTQANRWAAFMEDGKSPDSTREKRRQYDGTRYERPLACEYEPDDDILIESVRSLRWVGTDQDEVIDEARAAELLKGLEQ